MSVPTGAGNYPAGVTDNDPHFDLPNAGLDVTDARELDCGCLEFSNGEIHPCDEDRCELLQDIDSRCPNRATRIVIEPYTPGRFTRSLCDECAESQIKYGYLDGGLIAPEESL